MFQKSASPFMAANQPILMTSTTLTFFASSNATQEKELKPGEKLCFPVTPGRLVRNVTLIHRKDAKYFASITQKPTGDYWDSQGAYVSVTIVDERGIHHKYPRSKFAEPRDPRDPEHEGLHDWQYYCGFLSATQIQVENVSPTNHAFAVVNVKAVVIEFFPTRPTLCVQEEVFTQGSTFVKINAGILLPCYGGGYAKDVTDKQLQEKGLYPDAVQIGPTRGNGAGGKFSYVKGNCLHIKLTAGLMLGGFEISCGDTYFDVKRPAIEQLNKDGHIGSLGNAKLFVRLTGEGQQYFMSNVNVPPAGVLSGGPCQSDYVVNPNDEIIVESRHTTWVMAYRVVYVQVMP